MCFVNHCTVSHSGDLFPSIIVSVIQVVFVGGLLVAGCWWLCMCVCVCVCLCVCVSVCVCVAPCVC